MRHARETGHRSGGVAAMAFNKVIACAVLSQEYRKESGIDGRPRGAAQKALLLSRRPMAGEGENRLCGMVM